MMTLAPSPPLESQHAGYRAGAWLRRGENLLFMLVIALQLIPIWSFKYLPTTDGPAHVANAAILRDYKRPEAASYREYYLIRKWPDPNLLGHVAMAGLMTITKPLIAEKLLVCLYIVLLPIAFRYALGGIRRDAGTLGFLIFPFTFSYLFHMGFYNFCLSIAGYFFVVGYWLRHRDAFAMRQTITFTILTLALYCCHLFSLMMAGLTIGVLSAALVVWDAGRSILSRHWPDRPALWRAIQTRLLLPFYATLPALVLGAGFYHQNPETHRYYNPGAKLELLADLLTLDISFRNSEVYLMGALTTLLVLGGVAIVILKVKRRELCWWDCLLLAIPGILYIYLVRSGGPYYIQHRVRLYIFLVLAAWLAAQTWPHLLKRILQVGATAIAMAVLALSAPKYATISAQMEEFVSAEPHIAPNSTVLPLIFAWKGWTPGGGELAEGVEPFHFADGYLTYKKRIVSFRNYEASTNYFPVEYRPELNPYTHIALSTHGIELIPPRVDFVSYPIQTAGCVDYILLWGRLDEMKPAADHSPFAKVLDAAAIKWMLIQLNADYDLIYTSQPNALVHLYQRRVATAHHPQ